MSNRRTSTNRATAEEGVVKWRVGGVSSCAERSWFEVWLAGPDEVGEFDSFSSLSEPPGRHRPLQVGERQPNGMIGGVWLGTPMSLLGSDLAVAIGAGTLTSIIPMTLLSRLIRRIWHRPQPMCSHHRRSLPRRTSARIRATRLRNPMFRIGAGHVERSMAGETIDAG